MHDDDDDDDDDNSDGIRPLACLFDCLHASACIFILPHGHFPFCNPKPMCRLQFGERSLIACWFFATCSISVIRLVLMISFCFYVKPTCGTQKLYYYYCEKQATTQTKYSEGRVSTHTHTRIELIKHVKCFTTSNR